MNNPFIAIYYEFIIDLPLCFIILIPDTHKIHTILLCKHAIFPNSPIVIITINILINYFFWALQIPGLELFDEDAVGDFLVLFIFLDDQPVGPPYLLDVLCIYLILLFHPSNENMRTYVLAKIIVLHQINSDEFVLEWLDDFSVKSTPYNHILFIKAIFSLIIYLTQVKM